MRHGFPREFLGEIQDKCVLTESFPRFPQLHRVYPATKSCF